MSEDNVKAEPLSEDPHADNLQVEDNVEVIVRGPDGEIKQVVTGHNLVTTVGLEKLVERGVMASPSTEGPKFIAVGKSGTAAAAGDTTLGEELKRKEATTRSVSAKVGTLAVVFAATEATGAIKEAGLLSAASTGTLYARIVFEVVNVGAADSLEIKHTITYA